MGMLVPPEEEGDVGSEVSQWELRERREQEEERRAEAEALGAGEELGDWGEGGGRGQLLFLPTLSFGRRGIAGGLRFRSVLSFL